MGSYKLKYQRIFLSRVLRNQWWETSGDRFLNDMMDRAAEEYGSEMILKDFEANISDANLNAIESELRSLDLTFDKKSSNIITVSGRDESDLNGTRLLNAFRRYDRNARCLD